mgnify:CR=1 FL=1
MLTVWITGASSGIGEACAYKYAAEGARVILTSSSVERLEVVAARCREKGAESVTVLAYDLGCQDGIDTLTDKAWEVYDQLVETYFRAKKAQAALAENEGYDLVVAGGGYRIHCGSPFAGIEASAYVDDVFGGIFPKSRKIFKKSRLSEGESRDGKGK